MKRPKTTIDNKTGAIYIQLSKNKIYNQGEFACKNQLLIIDLDKNNNIVGLEIITAGN